MADVNWRQDALDLANIIDYIKRFNLDAAREIGAKLFDLSESLTRFPRRGRPAANDTRELVTTPPYVLTYEVDGDTVHILSIRHGARRPLD
ncbi:type II toxin-antitoxin system RelE/ParE family toxin [Sphingomonas rubra]|uniref:Plasmid stabilization system protein ParE n=1 Tax=Sphingomonas rubra TaxID=634430 RepID=A0A1I5U371_9SPHN|nr:type II toxin-antitoxin system RelE/ParE family toxin [Sphingomonas rubra]SFP89743.1 Plasmid stabilization system protein ParE [Sphingomonas rubra]